MSSTKKVPAWVQLLVIAVGVAVLVGGFALFLEWQRTRPVTPPGELRVEVSNGGSTLLVEPYTVCGLDEQCDGGEPPTFELNESSPVTFSLPDDIASSSWALLSIYDDPTANEEQLFQSGEADTATTKAVKDGARLVVAEVSFLSVDTTADGEERPVVATWSVAFE
ncbi:DUF2771 family protein [Corynebacterium timonense]|uniref:DUF2771 domain-containing protein n=1 Tax=Corynebacterium timonense TaxID=441500 RepID=A0A1H1RE82_9CORY|nr:DUF2771 family protein [Corynebacterium timonense]SDS33995.1 Protein of unknown function [Corynebacterium timonense]